MAERESTPQQRLRQSRLMATGLLALMFVLFLVTASLDDVYPWLSWIRAFSEAALVGGLADWFAVTALFRHPLGLPIPHTAIIPRKRDRLADTLGGFVQENFLSEDALATKVSGIGPAERLVAFMSNPDRQQWLANELSKTLPAFLDRMSEEDITHLVQMLAADVAEQVNGAALVGTLLEAGLEGEAHGVLLSQLLRAARIALDEHEFTVRETVSPEMPWWVPPFVARRLSSITVERLRLLLEEVERDLNHEFRARITVALRQLASELQSSPAQKERAMIWTRQLVQSPLVRTLAKELSDLVRRTVRHDCVEKGDDSQVRLFILTFLRSVTTHLEQDLELQKRLDRSIREFVRQFAREHRATLVSLVSDTVKRWDTETVIEKVELFVGRDLQYIRINGTLVGGFVGLCIYAVSRAL